MITLDESGERVVLDVSDVDDLSAIDDGPTTTGDCEDCHGCCSNCTDWCITVCGGCLCDDTC